MFWLALLLLGLLGFNRPRRALANGMKSAPETVLKLATFIGVTLFLVFGFLGFGLSMDFFVAVLVAAVVWIGVLAALEQLRRSRLSKEQSIADAIQVDAVWRKRRRQRQDDEPGKLFSDDPWGVIAAQREAGTQTSSTGAQYFNRAETEPEPLIQPHVGAGRDDSGLVFYTASGSPEGETTMNKTQTDPDPGDAEPDDQPREPETRSEIVSILKQHADRMHSDTQPPVPPVATQDPAPEPEPEDTAEPEELQPEPEEQLAAADDTADTDEQKLTAAEPVEEQYSETWLQELAPAEELDRKITEHKDELEARPLASTSGRYKYKPQLVKSKFSRDDD